MRKLDPMKHIPSATPFMEMLAAITVKGSNVCIATPDSGHPSVPENLADWNELVPPEHVQFFNWANLTQLFTRAD